MKTFLTCILLSGIFLLPASLKAQDCSQGLSIIDDLWQNFDPVDLVNNQDAIKEQSKKLKNELASFASMSLKKDAPRILPTGKSKPKKVNLKKGKKRVFITTPLKKDEMVITIARPETTSEVSVTICSHTVKGKSSNLQHITLSTGDTNSLVIPLQGVVNQIISVDIKNLSENKITYQISAK